MIEFYQTPVGKSIVSKQNNFINDLPHKISADFYEDLEFGKAVEQATQKHSPMFEMQLQEIF